MTFFHCWAWLKAKLIRPFLIIIRYSLLLSVVFSRWQHRAWHRFEISGHLWFMRETVGCPCVQYCRWTCSPVQVYVTSNAKRSDEDHRLVVWRESVWVWKQCHRWRDEGTYTRVVQQIPGLFFSVVKQWQLKIKTIIKLQGHYCTLLIVVSFMTSCCDIIIIEI